jgi:hypothetical protein
MLFSCILHEAKVAELLIEVHHLIFIAWNSELLSEGGILLYDVSFNYHNLVVEKMLRFERERRGATHHSEHLKSRSSEVTQS